MLRYSLPTVMLLIALVITAPTRAEIDPELKAMGWDEILFDDKPANVFTNPPGGDGESAVNVYSEASVSVAFLDVDIDIAATPVLSWEWLSRSPDPDTDTTQKGGDDRTLAVYVAFPWQPETASFGERLQRPLVEALKGSDTPGRVLTYVWGGGAPAGEGFENPYTGKYGRMIILKEPGTALHAWHRERVDIRQDFIDAFGFEPANPVYIAVGADSDDTEIIIRAAVRDLRFSR